MEKLILFLKIIAWVCGILSTTLSVICIYATLTYPDSMTETIDKLQGKTRSYPVTPWFIAAVICWAFIIAF